MQLYILTLIPALVLLGQVRDLKYMVPFSMLANIFMMSGFAITLYYIFSNVDLHNLTNTKLISSVEQLPRFFATVIFAIEGIGVVSSIINIRPSCVFRIFEPSSNSNYELQVMPVANNMKHPQHFLGCPSVLNITMSIVVSLYAMMGLFGYLAYGEKAQGSITLNLPTEEG